MLEGVDGHSRGTCVCTAHGHKPLQRGSGRPHRCINVGHFRDAARVRAAVVESHGEGVLLSRSFGLWYRVAFAPWLTRDRRRS